ncbi:MAG: hypothetical protein JWN98_2208, partial [Abditibacteriota bacterium]|nr:hypothetical protein [Abditibacteriota bacterium]
MCIIRPAAVCDALSLITLMKANEGEPNLMNEVGEFSLTLKEEIDWIERMRCAPNSIHLIAECDGRVRGTCVCQGGHRSADRHVARLGIVVQREFRGRGI